jgi:hypothetical protein
MKINIIFDFNLYDNPNSPDPLVMCRHWFCPDCRLGSLYMISDCGHFRSVSCSRCGSVFLYSLNTDYFLRILSYQ